MKKIVKVLTLLIISCSGLAVAQNFNKNDKQPLVSNNKNNIVKGIENRNFGRFLGESQNLTINVNGLKRDFIEYSAPEDNGEKIYKGKDLIIVFHGGKGNAERMKSQTMFVDLAKSNDLVLVFPEGIDHQWNDGRVGLDSNADVEFTRQLVKKYKDLGINKVMATGFSNGAIFSLRLGCEDIPGLNYIGSISGALPEKYSCAKPTGKHVVMLNGTDDKFVKWDGGLPDDLNVADKGGLIGVEDTLQVFEKANQCSEDKSVTIDINFNDRSAVEKQSYRCKKGSLLFYKIDGGGHTIPGGRNRATISNKIGNTNRDISAERELIDFLKNKS
jgi:polyhydroxybutyrate depolymerase